MVLILLQWSEEGEIKLKAKKKKLVLVSFSSFVVSDPKGSE